MAMAPFEVSIAILNHVAPPPIPSPACGGGRGGGRTDSRLVLLNNCGHWPPFEKPAEWTAQVRAFLKGY
jgi:pimeloyl-ACP methyl ester carboxylesterase